MNCKTGDTALYVGRLYYGMVFRVGRPHSNGYWRYTPRVGFVVAMKDANLRPIRDEPGEDETLTWAPVPTTIKEHA